MHRQGGSDFVDYSARYGALRGDDKTTLGETLPPMSAEDHTYAQRFGFPPGKALDMPIVALSNGQMRRARLLRALLQEPQVLLLDEPLSQSLRRANWYTRSHVHSKLVSIHLFATPSLAYCGTRT